MVKLSIVIPYYETYELTKKLLDSLIPQCNEQVEIILIDDGCNEIAFNDYVVRRAFNKMHVIHQDNHGVSYCRNKGIEEAAGEYIAFIDSDDMVMPNYIETLLELIDSREEDIILFNWLDINTNDVIRHPENCAVWKAIYKKDILPRFDETMKCREDYYFQKELDSKNCSKYYHDKVLYIYNSGRENSLTWKDKH